MHAESAARAAFRAAVHAASQSLDQTRAAPTSDMGDDLKVVEEAVLDRAVTAVFLLLVVCAILFSAFT